MMFFSKLRNSESSPSREKVCLLMLKPGNFASPCYWAGANCVEHMRYE